MAVPTFDLTGRKAVVTGGSTGLGYAMAYALAQSGAKVMISGRRESLLKEAADQLSTALGSRDAISWCAADLYDRKSVDEFAAHAIKAFNGVDIFVGNAGAVHAEHVAQITLENIDAALQLNLVTNITLTQAFLPHMRKQKWGRILFSSSTASHLYAPHQGNIIYSATKSGLNGFARSIAGDLGREGITVNNLIIGVHWTSILRGIVADMRKGGMGDQADELVNGFVRMTAVGRLGEVEDLHGIVQLLASDAGAYITGASIPMDGGTSIMMTPYPDAPA
ncbi:MAG: SDR family oxidoreductase [Steroidobacteraceae bacterium]